MDFYGSWSELCQRMDKTLADPQVQSAVQSRFHYVKLDVGRFERHAACCKQYGVTALPYLIVFNRDGTIRATQRGYNEPKAFLAFLKRAQEAPAPGARLVPARPATSTRQARLLSAAKAGDLATVRQLVQQGANLEAVCPGCGSTPLGHAASSGRRDVVEYLLSHGANVNGGGHTALHRAVERGDLVLARLLLNHGANPNARCPPCGQTPMTEAVARGNREINDLLRKHGGTQPPSRSPAQPRRPLRPSSTGPA